MPMAASRFIADCHLGKLAKYLRFMGCDTLFFNTIGDDELVRMAREEERTVLTRDYALSRRENAPVFYLRPTDAAEQLGVLADAFALTVGDDRARRCLLCNAPLETVGKETLTTELPEAVKRRFDFFQRCPACGRVYWHGDHYRRMRGFLEAALARGDHG